MRLKVNGVEIRVIDRIEIVLEVAEEGDTLLNGVDVHITGGPLTVNQGSHPVACIRFHQDSHITLNATEFTPVDLSNLSGDQTAKRPTADEPSIDAEQGTTYRVFLNLTAAAMGHNEHRHAQAIMKEIAENQGFKIIDSQPQTLFDGWEFWIESPNPPDLPPFAHICPWEPPPNRMA